MNELTMTVAAQSDVGIRRANNEDSFTIADLSSGEEFPQVPEAHFVHLAERPMLLAVSDGMGGHAAGEVASALVLESLRAAMKGAPTGEESGAVMLAKIDDAVRRANRVVQDTAVAQSKQGMGATLTAVFVDGHVAYIAEVGDSRAYLLRGTRLKQVTRDQSLVQMLVDTGVMTEEDAKTSPNRNMILQSMGQKGDVRVAVCRLQLRRLDRILICSDGVSGAVEDFEIAEILATSTPEAACRKMIDLANERGGKDNETAIVAHFEGEDFVLPLEHETVTSTLEALQDFAPTESFGAKAPSPAALPEAPAAQANSAQADPAAGDPGSPSAPPAVASALPADASAPADSPVPAPVPALGAGALDRGARLRRWIVPAAIAVLVAVWWAWSCCSK